MLMILMSFFHLIFPRFVLNKFYQIQKPKYSALPITAAMLALILNVINYIVTNRFLNFLQHSIGGGVAVGLITYFWWINLRPKYKYLDNILIKFVLIYALVSMYGVANELIEFGADQLTKSWYSLDRLDTWYDLLANTIGAYFGFLLALMINRLYRRS